MNHLCHLPLYALNVETAQHNEKGNTRQNQAHYEVKDAFRRRVDPLVIKLER